MLFWRAALVIFAVGLLCAQTPKPVNKQGILEALKIGGLTQTELVQFVRHRGVDFRPTPQEEAELKRAGASAPLLSAIKTSYRAPVQPSPASVPPLSMTKPLTKPEMLTLLQAQTPSERILGLARSRGIDFVVTPEVETQLRGAGAAPDLVASLQRLQPNHAPVALPAKKTIGRALVGERVELSGPPEPVLLAAPPEPISGGVMPVKLDGPKIHSLRDVRKLYIEPLPEGLDQAIRQELARQVPNRVEVVGSRAEAEAVLGGVGALTIVDVSGQRTLWAEDHRGRSVLAALKKNGVNGAAEKLVARFKKSLGN